jgi:hypothetical protein
MRLIGTGPLDNREPAPTQRLPSSSTRALRSGSPSSISGSSDRPPNKNAKDIADAIADGRRPIGMSADEEVVYDFATELQKNKRISDPTFNRAEQRLGKIRCGRYDRH